ncbi:hypothetical protein HPB48_010499 [Haemaphysalis longicornis]|uniref:Presenilin n=1 Tax=Haemaphysalis longicornis TaxID=44386 RepID=A0A9J6FNV7_HAELO|nr:hypothetical protein HPB48_010499 [Haemaphysalis longicornis]
MAQERPRVPADVVWGVLDDALVHVVRILAAVSCCMLLVVITVRINPQFLDSQGATLPYTPLPDTEEQTTVARASNAAGNALILIGVVIFMTTLMVSLYYYHFYKVIAVWITCACVLILLMTSNTYISLIFKTYNVPADYFSVGFFVYNFTALGLVVILSQGPLILQQLYLVIESAFMALMLITYLPPYTIWVVLVVVPIWDLVAVLAVHGPLRILVETAKERKEALQPGLVFATIVVGTFPAMASRHHGSSAAGRPSGDRGRSSESQPVGRLSPNVTPEGQDTSNRRTTNVKPTHRSNSHRRPLHATDTAPKPHDDTIRPGPRVFSPPKRAAKVPTETDLPVGPPKRDDADSDSSSDGGQERQGIKMGLGDFVFYSVLVGKVATFGDWAIVAACFVGILVGICVTLALLAVTQSALPALPVSLAFGLLFAGLQQSVQNFLNEVSLKHAFI